MVALKSTNKMGLGEYTKTRHPNAGKKGKLNPRGSDPQGLNRPHGFQDHEQNEGASNKGATCPGERGERWDRPGPDQRTDQENETKEGNTSRNDRNAPPILLRDKRQCGCGKNRRQVASHSADLCMAVKP